MNIGQAKQYIKDTVKLYLKKDEYNEYRIPVVRQRPIFLLGAPGVGKTAIMEQIAAELGIAFVSYSMTHHTRQSALGLPFIVQKEYGGTPYDVSEYTMSEIIASVYDVMENSGIKEGILFLDEINCVSETLAPSMLQFLQYKVFGKHAVPEGWVIVTAGNPPEYNKSVREFDVVTLDRLKVINVEADYSTWKQYAIEKRLHGAVIGYLEINKDDFYVIDTTVRGRGYVTARGWEDLSQIITLYEEEGMEVSEELIGQYLCNSRIVREFAAYYDLYCRYVTDYHVDDILSGCVSSDTIEKAKNAAMTERLSVVGILTDRLLGMERDVCEKSAVVTTLFPILKTLGTTDKDISEVLVNVLETRRSTIESKKKAGALCGAEKRREREVSRFIEITNKEILQNKQTPAYDIVKLQFAMLKAELKKMSDQTEACIDNVLSFAVAAFGEGNETVLLLTELTVNNDSASFFAMFPHEGYSQLTQRLMIDDPAEKIRKKIEALNL